MNGAEALFSSRGRDTLESPEEIMETLDAYDLTGSLRDAAELVGGSHHTVKRYVECVRRGAGGQGGTAGRAGAPRAADRPFLAKVEEWVERSKGKARADRVHAKLVWLGYTGSERTTRRVVAEVKRAYVAGHRRVHQPRGTEPGMWFQRGQAREGDGAGQQHPPAWPTADTGEVSAPAHGSQVGSVHLAGALRCGQECEMRHSHSLKPVALSLSSPPARHTPRISWLGWCT